MANFDNIIQEINTNLPDNTTQAITAAKLRTTLVDLTNQIDTVQDDFETEITGTIDDFIDTYQPAVVIDNLDSESSTSALSAKQGSKLADAVFGDDYISVDLLQTAEIVSRKAINKTTGELQSNSNYDVYKVLYDGTYETISGQTNVYQDGIAVAFYNSTTIGSASYMSEYSVIGVGTSSNNPVSYEDVTIPNGCVLIVTVKRLSNTFVMTTSKRSGGLVDDMADVISEVGGFDTRIDALEEQIGGANITVECNTDLTNKGLLKTGLAQTVTNRGVTNFFALNGNTSITLVSGAFTANATSYCAIAFYSAEDESTVVGWWRGETPNTEVNNDVVEIPTGANYARMMLMSYTVPAVVKFPSNLEVIPELVSSVADINEQLANIESDAVDYPQIFNHQLPSKSSGDTLNILLIGSSWGVDSITALATICQNVGLSVNTGNMYKSGGTIAQYLDDIANNRTNTYYFNTPTTPQATGVSKTVLAAVQDQNWDIIVLMNSAADSTVEVEGINTNFAKWLNYIKKNVTNPNVCFVINSTWTGKGQYTLQETSFKIVRALMKQSGINIINPAGSAVTYARTHTSLDTTNNLYRDSLHLNRGIGRFITAATMYYQLVYPVFGVGLDNCTVTGTWTQAASGDPTYPDIAVSDSNRATCIACAKEGVSNQFQFNIY